MGDTAHAETNPHWPDEWPKLLLPTREQVDVAIAFAQVNKLWVPTTCHEAFNNDPSSDATDGTEWTWEPWPEYYPNIPKSALWIWYDSGNIPDDRIPGVFEGGNHDEFLVYRVAGKAELIVQ